MKTFPKPLTMEEERDYLKRYRNGDMEAKNILIERNLRLVAHVARKYQTSDEETDDLISIGTIGLIKAVQTFDHTKNSKLGTYAAKCIENELLMLLRSRKKISREVSLYEPIGTDKEGNEISLLDIIESNDEDITEQMDLKENIWKLYDVFEDTLTEREKKVLIMRYGIFGGEERTQREIADSLGISRSYVSRIEKTALRKLRECLEKDKECSI